MNIQTITEIHTRITSSEVFRTDGPEIDLPAVLIELGQAVHALNHDDDTEHIWGTIGEHTEAPLGDLIVGAYWALSEWHAGQESNSYAALCVLGQVYSPGMECAPEEEDPAHTAYELINQWFTQHTNA